MELKEKLIDAVTGVKLLNGDILEIHVIDNGLSENDLILRRGDHDLVLKGKEVQEFIEILNSFVVENTKS